jgi:hypothetical protein
VPHVCNTPAVLSAALRYPTAVSQPVYVPASYAAHILEKEFEMELLIGFVTTLIISLLIFRT